MKTRAWIPFALAVACLAPSLAYAEPFDSHDVTLVVHTIDDADVPDVVLLDGNLRIHMDTNTPISLRDLVLSFPTGPGGAPFYEYPLPQSGWEDSVPVILWDDTPFDHPPTSAGSSGDDESVVCEVVVPEPTTASLLLLAGSTFLFRRRR
ncbi:MAG: PEP-CTERM sorting domain-containing protein [Patescibacteria group bacterium]